MLELRVKQEDIDDAVRDCEECHHYELGEM